MTTPTLPDYLREIYNLSPVAINALLLGVGGLNSDERDALMHEFTRPANGPFIEIQARRLPLLSGRGSALAPFLGERSILDKPERLCYTRDMKLIAQVKLQPTPEQADALRRTLETANAACNWLSEQAWNAQAFRQYDLHKLAYHPAREAFPTLSSQVVVRCIAKVADAYKVDRKRKRSFSTTGGIAYDIRILRWYVDRSEVSIWTVDGRKRIPFVCGQRQRDLLQTQRGESDLVLVKGSFYLLAVCDVEEPTPQEVEGVLGCDLGVVNILVDSDGDVHSASHVNNVRYRHRRLRQKLQKKGTKSAKRRLKKLAGKEARFAQHVNHVISKRIVVKAQCTHRTIALENLEGIRERVKARKPQRATLHSWSFFQLRQYITYKAALRGIGVILVDPRNTSRTCPVCGCIDKRNRPNQSTFLCQSCGFAGLADYIAARNIAFRAGLNVNQPNASALTGQGQSPLL